jgi:hypothetical protein
MNTRDNHGVTRRDKRRFFGELGGSDGLWSL